MHNSATAINTLLTTVGKSTGSREAFQLLIPLEVNPVLIATSNTAIISIHVHQPP